MKWHSVAAACAVVVAAVFYIGKPWTLHQCMTMAAKLPTDTGVTLMHRRCEDDFAKKPQKPWEMDWSQYTPANEAEAGSSTGEQGFIPLDEIASEQKPRDLLKESAKSSGQTIEEFLKNSK